MGQWVGQWVRLAIFSFFIFYGKDRWVGVVEAIAIVTDGKGTGGAVVVPPVWVVGLSRVYLMTIFFPSTI